MMAAVPTRARPFWLLVCLAGAVGLVAGMVPWRSSQQNLLFACYLVLTAVASALKAVRPGLEGTVSLNFVFFFVGICSMTLSETLALVVLATVVQCFWRRKALHFVHFAFNLAQVAVAITGAYWTYRVFLDHVFHGRAPIPLLVAAVVYFFLNTIPVATVIALSEGVAAWAQWTTRYAWTFPYYLVGAAIAGIIQLVHRNAGWEISVLILPALYAVYRSFRTQVGRWDDEKRHMQDMAALNMRTIETLALAIEAKDHTTGDHLQRVRVYALELAKDLELSAPETEALKAASVLHDIGKLAVPEHIISKPGKLTPEEFEKMKIHPIVGAEILEQVRFPYPVAPIVRCHHEKWDGSGYPDGISGGAIPIGARILAAVDCLDALASDRQYRRALPLDQAMAYVEKEAGKAFDPRVVAALKARYIELEELARAQEPEQRPKLSTDVKVVRGAAPDAGFGVSTAKASSGDVPANTQPNGRPSVDMLVPPADEVLTLEETLSSASVRLQHLVPYDAMAVYAGAADLLTPCFVVGESLRQLSSLRIRKGKGLAGWVAETGNAIINGNPGVEPGFSDGRQPALHSALAVPLRDGNRIVGVLALYRLQPDTFTAEHLGVLQTASQTLGATVAAWLDREPWLRPDPLQPLRTRESAEVLSRS
jgi:putative nucleotidyltransferase with HDIG domain